jgi:uncharacterized protein (DUF58 family)
VSNASRNLLTPEDLSSLKGLQVYAKNAVEGFCSGLHASPHKGFSVEFKQHRPYVSGDEIRRIDWKAFARTDRHYIREFEDETNLVTSLLVDSSGSMGYRGTAGHLKLDYARKLAACLGYLMMTQGDAVGMATFDTKVREILPARSKTSHLDAICKVLSRVQPGGETDPGEVLRSLAPRLRQRGLVVLISDCFGDVVPLSKALGLFRHRGHDVLVFQLWDRDELDFPFKSWTKFIDLENEENIHLMDPSTLRKDYLKNLAEFRGSLNTNLKKNRIDLVPLVTDEPMAAALTKYVSARLRTTTASTKNG